LAQAIKKTVQIPVITVGVIREPEFAENILAERKADFVAIGRGLIADPDWAQKAFMGRPEEINRCISCNQGCSDRRLHSNLSIRCAINPRVGREGRFVKKALKIN